MRNYGFRNTEEIIKIKHFFITMLIFILYLKVSRLHGFTVGQPLYQWRLSLHYTASLHLFTFILYLETIPFRDYSIQRLLHLETIPFRDYLSKSPIASVFSGPSFKPVKMRSKKVYCVNEIRNFVINIQFCETIVYFIINTHFIINFIIHVL